jgi:hypothetical protein
MLCRSFQRVGVFVFILLIIWSNIRLVKVSSLISSPVGDSNDVEMASNSLQGCPAHIPLQMPPL